MPRDLTFIIYFDNSRNMEIKTAVSALARTGAGNSAGDFPSVGRGGTEKACRLAVSARSLKVPGATLSFHLKELVRAGLVSSRQEKQFIYYAVDFERMAELMTFLTQNCCQGMPQKCLTVVETALGSCCAPAKSKTKTKRSRS